MLPINNQNIALSLLKIYIFRRIKRKGMAILGTTSVRDSAKALRRAGVKALVTYRREHTPGSMFGMHNSVQGTVTKFGSNRDRLEFRAVRFGNIPELDRSCLTRFTKAIFKGIKGKDLVRTFLASATDALTPDDLYQMLAKPTGDFLESLFQYHMQPSDLFSLGSVSHESRLSINFRAQPGEITWAPKSQEEIEKEQAERTAWLSSIGDETNFHVLYLLLGHDLSLRKALPNRPSNNQTLAQKPCNILYWQNEVITALNVDKLAKFLSRISRKYKPMDESRALLLREGNKGLSFEQLQTNSDEFQSIMRICRGLANSWEPHAT
ncbi:MAG: hypothetical protein KKA31_05855 [Candidatus Margulisbacteria bacterium]|nr:hypothetical protein [Candidatus Margulisiibacteriota bacterium]